VATAVNGDWSAALWALALLAALCALWAGRDVLVQLVCAVALAVLLSPALRRIDTLLRIRRIATIVVLGVAGTLASVMVVQAHPLVPASPCEVCSGPGSLLPRR
jgi:predicted PurR-regulated permease PerM